MSNKTTPQIITVSDITLGVNPGDFYGPMAGVLVGTDVPALLTASIPLNQFNAPTNFSFLGGVGPHDLNINNLTTLSAGLLYSGVANAFNNTLASTATNMANVTTVNSAQITTNPGNWSITSNPAAAAQSTITRAGVVGNRHICTSIHATMQHVAAGATALLKVFLRDGASGIGGILWSANIIDPGLGNSIPISLSGLSIVGTAGNAMTLEFDFAGGGGVQQNVSMTGYTVTT